MSDWPPVELSDVAELIGRGIAPRYTETGGIPVLNQKCIREGRVSMNLARRHDDAAKRVSAGKVLMYGDVLINSTGVGTLGRTAPYAHGEAMCVVDTHITVVRPRPSVVPRWLGYALRASEREIEALAEGTTGQTELKRDRLASLQLRLPPLDEQRRIAGLLFAFDEKIDRSQHLATVAEQLAVSEVEARSQDAEWLPLGSIASHCKTAVNPASLGDLSVDHFSIPAFDAGRRPAREPASSIKSGKLVVAQGDVLVSRLNPRTPRVWWARVGGRLAMCSTEFLVLRPILPLVSPGLIFAAVSQPTVVADMAQRATGTSGSHQRVRPADAMSVAVPVVKEAGLGPLLDGLLGVAAQARAEAATLAELRDMLLPRLLSGELRVREVEQRVEALG